jgi:CHAT domain
MSLVVDFKEFGFPVQVLFGLANSASLAHWQCDPADAELLAAVDQLPWGQRPEETPPAVRHAGRMLRAKLAGVAALQKALTDAFAAGALGTRPLYFRTGMTASVEGMPFEALWDDHIAGFPCLAQPWPIARIPADATTPGGPFTMERSVRIAAVVAAEGIDPARQVDALLTGCQAPAVLSVELTILTTTAAAVSRVNSAGIPGWRAELVPATSDGLIRRLRELQPHLLHVFCHGTADGPRLLVSQRDDLAELEISAENFGDLARPSFLPPWLVTLNCCEGAAPGEQTVSLASAMVRNGLPAVIGMRKAIDACMADRFCADFYEAALARLALIASRGRAPAPLNWSEVLFEPRRRLCAGFGAPGLVADRQKEWTMPVLYVASPDLQLRGRPTAPPGQMDDQQIRNDVTTIAVADQLEASGNLPPQQAAAMRDASLDRLYPQG